MPAPSETGSILQSTRCLCPPGRCGRMRQVFPCLWCWARPKGDFQLEEARYGAGHHGQPEKRATAQYVILAVTHTCVWVCAHAETCMCTRTCACVESCTHIWTGAQTQPLAHSHTCIRAHTGTHTWTKGQLDAQGRATPFRTPESGEGPCVWRGLLSKGPCAWSGEGQPWWRLCMSPSYPVVPVLSHWAAFS